MILRAAVVDVLPISALGLLRLRLAGDRATTVAALDQFACIGHLVRAVEALTEKLLDPIPRRPINEWLVRARKPLVLVPVLALDREPVDPRL